MQSGHKLHLQLLSVRNPMKWALTSHLAEGRCEHTGLKEVLRHSWLISPLALLPGCYLSCISMDIPETMQASGLQKERRKSHTKERK